MSRRSPAAAVLPSVYTMPIAYFNCTLRFFLGPIEGTAIVSLASTLGAVAAFLIARYLAQVREVSISC